MKLYYTPGACSLAPHIIAEEAGISLDLVKVDLATHKTLAGEDFYKINPRGYVPVLEFDDGERLTEAQVTLQALADMRPEANLIPKAGTRERLRVLSALGFIATELHKGFGPLWAGAKVVGEQAIGAAKSRLAERFKDLDGRLGEQSYVAGQSHTVADAYAFVILNWAKIHRVDLDGYPNILAWQKRIAERPAVKRALQAEGLA
jgi:glutathione S-transferase